MKKSFVKFLLLVFSLFIGTTMVFADGQATMKSLSGGFKAMYSADDAFTNIETIKFIDTTETEFEENVIVPIDLAATGSTSVDAYFYETEKELDIVFAGTLQMPTSMKDMFLNLINLKKIIGFENVSTTGVTSMVSLFQGCSSLTDVDVSHFNTTSVTSMSAMFRSTGLIELDLNNFDTAAVTDMSYMFSQSSALESVNVSSFDTSIVTKFQGMFSDCPSLTKLDLKSFTYTGQSGMPNMKQMFNNSTSLETIYVASGTDFSTALSYQQYTSMFSNCTSLVGEKGTVFNGSYVNNEYARVDGGVDSPGYFSSSVSATDFDVLYEVNQVFTGSPIYPEVVVKYHGTTLTKDTDYTLEITNNVNIGLGTGTITITGIGNYKDSIVKYFDINPRSINSATVDPISDQTYTGSALTPNVTVRFGQTVLVKDTDYILEYHNNINAGDAYVAIIGINEYTGETSADFTIVGMDVNNLSVGAIDTQTYTGSAITPNVVVANGSNILVKDTDYTLTYNNNVNVGEASVTITGIGNYRSSRVVKFKICTDIAGATIDSISEQVFTTNAIEPTLVVKFNGTTLVKNTDYTVEYTNNVNVGQATVTITGKGDYYIGSNSTTFNITQASISGATVNANAQEYTGKAVLTTATVKFNGKTLVDGTDYTLEFSNNIEIGSANVKVVGKGNFNGNKNATFSITQANINNATVAAIANQKYTGNAITPKVNATFNGMALVEGTDYTLEYSNNIYTGNASVILVGHNRFKDKKTVTFKITGANIGEAVITSIKDQTYTARNIEPTLEVKYNNITLTKDKDYRVQYSDNKNVGTATVTISGMGSFSETKTATFKIVSASISNATIEAIDDQLYTGKEIKPSLVVKFNDVLLTEGTDYNISYKNNINPGQATATITGKNNFSGSKSTTFKIAGLDLSNMTFDKIDNQIYTGSAITPEVVIRFKDTILQNNTDYKLTYTNNVNAGTATVKATGINQYTGTLSTTFKIYYGITYNLNGGKNDARNPEYYDNTVVTKLFNPTKAGYVFKGWYTSDTYKTKVTEIAKGSKGNKTLYAKWSAVTYTIKFNKNGGKGTTKDMTLKYEKTYKLNKNKYTKKGYSFVGWTTKKDGTGTAYANEEEVKNLTSTNKAVITLYAQWTKKKYTIVYNLKGGILAKENKTEYYINTKTFKLNNPTKIGYKFVGWYKNKKYKGAKITKIVKGSTGNKTLYAKYTPNRYYIIFNKNGGRGTVRDITAKYNKSYTLTKNSYTKKGYKFVGWNTKKDGSGTSYKNKEVVKNLTTKNNKKITLYAQWKKIEYTITYELNGGVNNETNPQTYNVKTATIKLAKPTKEGYKFVGWYSNKKLTVRVKTIDKGSTGNKKLYAKWKKIS